VHGTLTGVDLDARRVVVRTADGRTSSEAYDVLVISTGVTNGFWRRPHLQSGRDVDGGLRAVHDRLAEAGSVIVVGGDVAATDPLRCSARNRADRLLAHNVLAHLDGRPLRRFRPRRRRWGSVVGVQPEGLDVFSPSGRAFRIPAWSIDPALQPWIEWGIYRGVRDGRA
jgi:hypothetical protein